MRGFFTVVLLYLFFIGLVGCTQPVAVPTATPLPSVVPSYTAVRNTPTPSATPFPPTPTYEAIVDDFFVPTELFIAVNEDPHTLDPAYSNNRVGAGIIEQVYETLVTYKRESPIEVVPQLAEAMPAISEDGLTYTFTIRQGVYFQNGTLLTAEDVAYSLQRGLLQGEPTSMQFRLALPLLGVHDVSELVLQNATTSDSVAEALQTADPVVLVAACERVKNAIRVDGNTVMFTLVAPNADFVSALAGWWASILDKEWVSARGGWDGDCATWHSYYGISPDQNPLSQVTNGTGPYYVGEWNDSDWIVLQANEAYWRTESIGSAWEGGKVGIASIELVALELLPDEQDRINRVWSGEADMVSISVQGYDEADRAVGEVCRYDFSTGQLPCTELEKEGFINARVYTGLPHWTFDVADNGLPTAQMERYYTKRWNYQYYYNPATAFPYFYALKKTRQ